MNLEIAKKNCRLCQEYGEMAAAARTSDLKLGFFRLRDESVNRALRAIAEFGKSFTDSGETALLMFEVTSQLEDACIGCDNSKPAILRVLEERSSRLCGD